MVPQCAHPWAQHLEVCRNTAREQGLPGNTKLGYALKKFRADLLADLGGEDNMSTQQRCIIDKIIPGEMIISSLDAWILVQPSLINKRKKALHPIVLQRQQLVESQARLFSMLGLERRHKVKTIGEILSHDDSKPSHGMEQGNGQH